MASPLPQLSPTEFTRNRGPHALAADIVPRACAIIVVGLRFYARRLGGSKLLWDDWLILFVAILFVPAIAVEVKMTQLGLGRHIQWVLTHKPEGLPLYAKLAYADQLVYAPLIAPIKVSILYLYLRIFGVKPRMRWACIIQIVLVIIWGLVTLFLFVFQCKPVSVAWSPTRAGGECFEYRPLFIGTNTANVVMDFAILVTPLPSIWGLNLAPAKKLWVSAVLGLGACECIFSAIRLAILSRLEFVDVTWDHADALIWSTVETAVGALCACIPVLGPLLPRAALPRTQVRGSNENNFVSYGSGKPRKGYAKFGASRNTETRTDNGSEDQFELVGNGDRLGASQIQRTVDWEVRNEEREAGNDFRDQKLPREL